MSKITKLCFGLEIFWRQNIAEKNVHIMLMKLTLEVDFINIRLRLFLHAQDERLFWAHSVLQIANKFGKKCTYLSSKFGVLIVGEIEW